MPWLATAGRKAASLLDEATKMADAQQAPSAMQHGVGVRANGYQIPNWIDLISFWNLRNLAEMVHVNDQLVYLLETATPTVFAEHFRLR